VAWLVGLVLLLVITALLVVLYTPWGTRTALSFALDRYDAMIPGAVAVDGIDGTLGGTLIIDALALSDSQDNPLVAVTDLRLQLRLADLVHLTVGFDELAVGGLELWFGAERANFGDLGPPGDPKPKPDGMVGPDIPIGFLGPLALDGIVMHRNLVEGGDEVLLAVPLLRAKLDSKGRAATVQIDGLAAVMNAPPLVVAGMTGTVQWNDPEIRIAELVVLSDRGIVTHADLGFDAYQQTGDAELGALVDIAGLAPKSQLPIHGPVPLELHAAGGAEGVWAHIVIAAEPDARVDLLLGGSISPRLQLAGAGVFQLIPPGAHRPFASFLAVQAFRLPDLPLLAWAQLRCIGCREPVGALAHSNTSHDGKTTSVDARVFLADASVTASATIDEGALTRARARVEVPSLRNVGATLQPWIAVPPVAGTVAATASCHGREALLRCTAVVDARRLGYQAATIGQLELDAAVEISHGDPSGAVTLAARGMRWKQHTVDSLRVDAHGDRKRLEVELGAKAMRGRAALVAAIEPGAHTTIGLRSLAVDLQTLHVRLARPSELRVGGGTVAIDDLRLAINRGAIAIDGVIGQHSDATVAIEQLELAELGPLKLPVRLFGTVDARAELHGETKDPQVSLVAEIDRLWIEKHQLGRVGAELGLDHGRVDARVEWEPGPRERLELSARGQLRAFDDRRGPGVVPRAELVVALDAERLELSRLQPLLGERVIGGRLDASLRIIGTGEQPVIAATVDGSALRLDDLRVTSLQARVDHEGGRVALGVDASAPWLDGLHVSGSVPVRVAAVAPYYSIGLHRHAEAGVVIDRLDLSGLEAVAPGLELAGRVDGEVSATLDAGKLRGRAGLLARGLARKGERIATVSLDAALDQNSLVGKLQASGAAARLLELELAVPLRVDVDAGKITWLQDDPHDVQLSLADADVGALGRLAGLGGIAGRIDGTASLVGTAHAPTIAVDLSGRRLAWAGHPLGRVELTAHHERGHVRAAVRQGHGVQHLRVDADVPMSIDLATRKLDWDRRAAHTLELDAVAVDQHLLAPFVALPEDLAFDLNAELHARGNVDVFGARGQLRADIGDQQRLATPVAGRFAVSQVQQSLELVIGPFEDSAIELSATAQAPIRAMIDGTQTDWKTIPVVASLDTSQFPLRSLDALLPQALDKPDGRLEVHVGVAGTAGVPNLHGNIDLRDAAITVVPLRQRFDRVHLAVGLDRRDIELVQLSARSGAGRASVKGKLHLERGATVAQLDLHLEGLPIIRPGMPLMKLTTRATAKLDASGKATEIDVVARKSVLDVFTATVTAPAQLPTTEGVVFVDTRTLARGGELEGDAQAEAEAQAKADADTREPLLPADMHLRFKLADPVYVRGPQANMTWRGGVTVAHNAGEPVHVEGALIADRGRINFLGHDFVIDSGRITLPERGDIDPYIAITAVTQTPEGIVTIDVHGRASRPELRLSSDPPMPESDVFALLVTGSSSGADKGEGGDVGAKAASLLAAFQNPVLQRELQDSLGIDRVGVSFGDSVDQPILAVGKRVSKKVYLETRYHHNAPVNENHAEIHLEYTIKAPAWSVETFIGDAAKGGLELWWRRRFGRPPEPRTTAKRDREHEHEH
jgi:autotransporter translocation and assembly factor TamB